MHWDHPLHPDIFRLTNMLKNLQKDKKFHYSKGHLSWVFHHVQIIALSNNNWCVYLTGGRLKQNKWLAFWTGIAMDDEKTMGNDDNVNIYLDLSFVWFR